MPLVNLALAKTEFARDSADVVALPVGVLDELVLKDTQLVLILSLAALNISVSCVLVLRFLEKR